MNENKNWNLPVLIAVLLTIVFATFFNNYFAYYFLTKNEGVPNSTGDKKSISEKINASVTDFKIKDAWNWNYDQIDIEENNYPMVVLRDGYKAIKVDGKKVLMGWQYEVLNTSPSKGYNVTVDYRFEDKDGFVICESSGSEIIAKKEYDTVKNTVLVSYSDYNRILRRSWSVQVSPDWSEEKLKGTPLERAGELLKQDSPYWLEDKLKSLFMDDFPPSGGPMGIMAFIHPAQWAIAKALGIGPEPQLIEVGKKLNIDFTKYELPPWKVISANQAYSTLTEPEKATLKSFLTLAKDYGGYSPLEGRKFDFVVEDDFPEPEQDSPN